MQQTGRTLRFFVIKHGATNIGIPDKRHAGDSGYDFPQQLQPLPTELRRDTTEAGDISAGAREARHESGPDWIATVAHYDWDRLSLSFDRRNRHICGRHDHVHLEAHQLPRKLRKSFGSGLAVAKLQDEGFPFDIAKLLQPLPERLKKMRCSRWSARKKVPDLRDFLRLLRLGERTCREKEKRD